MPNWIVGNLKIRGMAEDIMNFLENSITGVEHEQVQALRMLDSMIFITGGKSFHLAGSNRGFITTDKFCFEEFEEEEEATEYLILPVKFAWKIDREYLINRSKKFNLDIKINAFEQYNFQEEIFEVASGEKLKDIRTAHENRGSYVWYSSCPS